MAAIAAVATVLDAGTANTKRIVALLWRLPPKTIHRIRYWEMHIKTDEAMAIIKDVKKSSTIPTNG